MARTLALASLLVLGCSAPERPRGDAGPRDAATHDAFVSTPIDTGPRPDVGPLPDAPPCAPPPIAAGSEVELAPEFASFYGVFTLGSVPGVPNPLGGIVVSADDPDVLLVAGASERPDGAIYSIRVRRDACGHIVELLGTASVVASAPYVDANLVYGPDDLLVYTEWPVFNLSQLARGATMPSRQTDLRMLGIATGGDQGPGGIGYVPVGLGATGQLRIVTWPEGHWYQVGATLSGGLYTIDSLTETATLANNPGGFAYVPAGSPGFAAQSLIVAEWRVGDRTLDRVAVYETDASGDPITSTRREFFVRFPRPWGAYFEPVTGDYLFPTLGDGDDRIYIVQGFVPPAVVF